MYVVLPAIPAIQELHDIWRDLPLPKLNILNWASLLTEGVGEDYVYLNESMADGKSLLDFPTLHDYDYADYLFQESAKKKEFPDYNGVDYFAFQHPCWARLLIDDEFYYATFLSLARYLADEIGIAGDNRINQLIPHQFIEGKNQGKREEGGFLWDMKIDAASSWLAENHKEIIKNFDPKVAKLRKRRKIVFSAAAMEDLAKLGPDDESLD